MKRICERVSSEGHVTIRKQIEEKRNVGFEEGMHRGVQVRISSIKRHNGEKRTNKMMTKRFIR